MSRRRIPGVFTMTIADCFCGAVAAILVCTFLVEIIQERDSLSSPTRRDLILQVQSTGYGPAGPNGRRAVYPVPIVADLLVEAGGRMSFDHPVSLAGLEGLRSIPLRGSATAIPRGLGERADLPREVADSLFLRLRGLDPRGRVRCLISIRPYSLPPEPLDYLEFRGFLVDPTGTTRKLAAVTRSTLTQEAADRLHLVPLEDGAVKANVRETVAGIRLLLRPTFPTPAH